jgi:hypothetical protein
MEPQKFFATRRYPQKFARAVMRLLFAGFQLITR